MDFDWGLLQRANEEKDRIEKEFKKKFFQKKDSYFYDIQTDVEINATEVIIKTNYNSYKFRRKQDGSFILKKDKLEQYFYTIDASYTIDTWQKGLEAAREDFEQIIAIKDDICSYLEENSKFTFSDSVRRFYTSVFGKKEEAPSIELKDEEKKEEKSKKTEENEQKDKKEEKPKDENTDQKVEKKEEKTEKNQESEKNSKPKEKKTEEKIEK